MASLFRNLNSPGGRIVVLVTLIVLGLASEMLGVSYAKDIVLTTLGTLMGFLAGTGKRTE